MDLVQLDRDHPGFRDPIYRSRRNEIAHLAVTHEPGAAVTEVSYTDEEHKVWHTAYTELAALHARYACREYLSCVPMLGFSPRRIPRFADVNAVLSKATRFSLSPVAGLVSPASFMRCLGEGQFLATQYVRHASAPLYTPEPDVIHELIGHAATLSHSAFARINRLFGEATERADDTRIGELIRAYWYTLEFGVVREQGALRAVGAGLLSSYGELGRFETQTELRPFNLDIIARTPFDPTDYQRVLFVADNSATLLGDLETWLSR